MAKRKAPQRGASRNQAPKRQPVPGWLLLAVGLAIGAFITFLTQLEPGRDDIKRPREEAPKSGSAQVTPKPVEKTQEAAKPKYDFYTLLPESEVIVPPEALPEKAPPKPSEAELRAQAQAAEAARAEALLNGQTPPPRPAPVNSTQFFLQAGSFPSREKAESVRAQILLLGQDVRVESGTVADKTWHRVLVGPFASREQLSNAQKQLAGNGFNNLLLQKRQAR